MLIAKNKSSNTSSAVLSKRAANNVTNAKIIRNISTVNSSMLKSVKIKAINAAKFTINRKNESHLILTINLTRDI